MTRTTYHFTFAKRVPPDAVEDALVLAVFAAEALREGSDEDDTLHVLDAHRRTCVVDATTDAGADTLRIFEAFVSAMFGRRSFRVVTGEDLAEAAGRADAPRGCTCECAGAAR